MLYLAYGDVGTRSSVGEEVSPGVQALRLSDDTMRYVPNRRCMKYVMSLPSVHGVPGTLPILVGEPCPILILLSLLLLRLFCIVCAVILGREL